MDSYNYVFPAIRGIQAQREYYVAMCPLKLVPRILVFDSVEMAPEFRSQRILNKSRIPQLVRYIVDNPTDYVFSALTVSVDSEVEFTPVDSGEGNSIGQLIVPMTANIIVNDGQHRRAAIEGALEKRPGIGNETIALVFFLDAGHKRSQQMFADLNRYAIRPTRSLSILYDHRDTFAALVHQVMKDSPIFDGMIELEKTSISNRSPKLFTLSSLYQALKALLRDYDPDKPETLQLALDFWSEIGKMMPDWARAKAKKVNCLHLRQTYVHSHGVTLYAIGMMGASLLKQYPKNWKPKLKLLNKMNWKRSNKRLWEGRAMIGGKMSKTTANVRLTANVLKKRIGLTLNKDDTLLEEQLKKG